MDLPTKYPPDREEMGPRGEIMTRLPTVAEKKQGINRKYFPTSRGFVVGAEIKTSGSVKTSNFWVLRESK